jgi:succinate dehydrogenase / fumarate reductase cytochrome b subunit
MATLEQGASMSTGGVLSIWNTSVGKKAVMAVTGIILVGFVVVHMVGNLKIYAGEDKYNAYAAWLREIGSPAFGHEQVLWIARLVLLACVALHIIAATQLTLMSRAARPIPYSTRQHLQATYASRTLRWGGVIIVLFIIYHLLHFTFGAVGYVPGQFRPLSVYRNVVLGFSVWYVSAFYVVAQLTLGLHLYHGVWSLFQTLGVENIRASRFYRGLAGVMAIGVVAGNVSMPLAVLAGLLR